MADFLDIAENEADDDDFHRLFLRNQKRIFLYILTLLPQPDDAEEVFQETCVTILKKADQFGTGNDTDFIRWACKIAHYKRCSYRHRKHTELLRFSDAMLDTIAEQQVEIDEHYSARSEALRHCMDQLRPDDRELLQERYRRQITSKELAKQFNRPVNTVYKTLQRTRRQLHDCVERTITRETRE